MQTLESNENGLARVVVDVAMPSVPEISTFFADENEAEVRPASPRSPPGSEIGSRGAFFAVEGGLQGR